MEKTDKKVEYLELIYDLIFVYIIGRNQSLLQNLEHGFVSWNVFLTYILCSLAIIQIWNFSTFYTNMYGRNSIRDHIFMFVNMYLLYYMAAGTRLHWQSFQNQYHFCWALILINIGIQYLIEYRKTIDHPDEKQTVQGLMTALFGEAAIVLLAIPVYSRSGIPLAGLAILYGIITTWILADRSKTSLVDFTHLSERAMLYVVFTFGEMIIAIAPYFEDGLTLNSVYFSTMSFLIVVGLFLCYEILYDHIIDRDRQTSGMYYMMVHLFLIFAMNIITTSLEFMRNEAVLLWPKLLFLISAILLYFFCLFLLFSYAKKEMQKCNRFLIKVILLSGLFVGLMIVFREQMYINILVTVVYVGLQFGMIYRFWKYSTMWMVARQHV